MCGINHAFLTGFLDGLGAASATAVLSPSQITRAAAAVTLVLAAVGAAAAIA